MRCLYCHNPDTWQFHSEKHPDIGKPVTVDEILAMYDGVKEFLKGGGITCTGGETSGITFNPENTADVDRLLDVTDVIMLDIKHINDEEHKKLTGHSNKNILAFAEYASSKKKQLWIRHVVVPGITYNEKYLHELGMFISKLKSVKALDVLPYHDMGKVKYQNLGIDYPLKDVEPLPKAEAAKARDIIMQGIKDGLAAEYSKN